MITVYKLNQVINKISNVFIVKKSIKWVYIYGHHRGGTTYMLQQYLKVSKRGTGDWMLHEIIGPILKMNKRDKNRVLDLRALNLHIKRNLLKSAHIGGGFYFDIAIKQALGTQNIKDTKNEIEYFTKLFHQPPSEILFLYREPKAWYLSAEKKFNHSEELLSNSYNKPFEAFKDIGGTAIQYDKNCLDNFFETKNYFKTIKVDEFSPKKIPDIEIPKSLIRTYNNFKSDV